MNPRKLAALVCALGLILSFGMVATAGDRPQEGKVISIDKDAMMLTVQGEKDDQWTLYWTDSTELQGDLTIQELKVSDKIHFDYTEKDGKKYLTELRRTDKAEKS